MTNSSKTTLLPDTLSASNANDVVRIILSKTTSSGTDKSTLLNVDLSNVVHCDSAGLAALIAAKSQCQSQGVTIHYTAPSQQLLALANFLKVATWFSSAE